MLTILKAAVFAIYAAVSFILHSEPEPKPETYTVTAYALGDGYTPTHGVTASGERVKEGRTLACPNELPFGTEVQIPALGQTLVCTDRGGAIKGKRLDIYMNDKKRCLDFGKQRLEVIIILPENPL